MKLAPFIFLLSLISFSHSAQSQGKEIPITFGLYAPYGIQFGGKVGTVINLKKWDTEKEKKGNNHTNLKTYFVSPQIGLFVRLRNHTSLLINSDLGFKNVKEKRRFYKAYSLGLGYLNTFQITSSTFDLSTGEIVAKKRERRGYFLPTLNFEFGKEAKSRIGWYSKFSFGRKFSSKIENSTFLALELGLKVRFLKARN